jgi:hypothetical protein
VSRKKTNSQTTSVVKSSAYAIKAVLKTIMKYETHLLL